MIWIKISSSSSSTSSSIVPPLTYRITSFSLPSKGITITRPQLGRVCYGPSCPVTLVSGEIMSLVK